MAVSFWGYTNTPQELRRCEKNKMLWDRHSCLSPFVQWRADKNVCPTIWNGGFIFSHLLNDTTVGLSGQHAFSVWGPVNWVFVYARKKMNVAQTKIGMRTAAAQAMYPKKEGMRTPACSAMERTMKFGPLPM